MEADKSNTSELRGLYPGDAGYDTLGTNFTESTHSELSYEPTDDSIVRFPETREQEVQRVSGWIAENSDIIQNAIGIEPVQE